MSSSLPSASRAYARALEDGTAASCGLSADLTLSVGAALTGTGHDRDALGDLTPHEARALNAEAIEARQRERAGVQGMSNRPSAAMAREMMLIGAPLRA